MKVAIRADANLVLGTGHVMRCLTLADELRTRGAEVTFLIRSPAPYLAAMIASKGHVLASLRDPTPATTTKEKNTEAVAETIWSNKEQEADSFAARELIANVDWLIVDHYGLNSVWEKSMRETCRYLMAIDDLAQRSHDCDLLLDQNLGRNNDSYLGLVPASCEVYTGPQYALLRPEFSLARNRSLERRTTSNSHRILISMGGVDKDNATSKVLTMLNQGALPTFSSILVIMGGHAPWNAEVLAQSAQMVYPTEIRTNVTDMATLMADSDIAIGAAGGTAWERCCLGLPTLAITLADNQREGADALETAGCITKLDIAQIEDDFSEKLAPLMNPDIRKKMSVSASAITDGSGAAFVASRLMAHDEQ